MSRIVEGVANEGNADARSPLVVCNLNQYADFKPFCVSQPRTAAGAAAEPLTADDFAVWVRKHNEKGHGKLECLSLLQTMLGVRFDNLVHLFDPKKYVVQMKNCSCQEFELCNPIKNSCFSHIKFSSSKTGPLSVVLIPEAIPCLGHVKKYGVSDAPSNARYNQFLKQFSSSSITSHSLRKFTCNISFRVRNTAWKGAYNFDRFYKHENTQYCDIHFLLRQLEFVMHF